MSARHTPGPWAIATSCSWRRIVAQGMTPVCEPVTQADGHPDLHFRNGGDTGPDARLITAAPDLLEALQEALPGVLILQHVADSNQLPGLPRILDNMRAAIAKATGSAA